MAGGLFGAALTSRSHVLTSMVGLLAGAVAICAGAAIMHPVFAFITGVVAGVITTFTYGLMEHILKIDDATACFPVHGASGFWGALAAGLFGANTLGAHPIYGFATTEEWINQIMVQLVGAGSIALWTGAIGLILYWALNRVKMLRVSRDEELFSLDIACHRTYAYPEDMIEKEYP